MTAPAAVLWDLDGTLIDSEPVHIAAVEASLLRLGARPGPELHAELLGRPAREMHAWCVARYRLDVSFLELCALKYEAYARLAGRLRPRQEVWEVFLALRQRGVRAAFVSNSDRLLVDLNLKALGLALPECVSVSRNDVREGKPDPEPFLRAAWLLGEEPAGCAVVEDSPVGALAGLAAGMRVACWPDPNIEAPLDFPAGATRVGSAAELAAWLG